MKLSRLLLGMGILLLIIIVVAVCGLPILNMYQQDGSLSLSGLKDRVTIMRDENGMAYVKARNIHDVVFGQGFATAQDRLFQMQLTRLVAEGRISELAGAKAKALDTRMRTIGIHRLAKKHAKILDDKTKAFFQSYVDGVNAFIKTCPKDIHLEFKAAGIKPETWTIEDSLAIVYYMGWSLSSKTRAEIVAQMLVEKVGLEKAREIFPININPDDPPPEGAQAKPFTQQLARLGIASDRTLLSYSETSGPHLGSNNWVVGPKLSPGDKPILANDPHLDARILPGILYPIGLITPKFRAVGCIVAGIPGFVIGRNDRVAMGATNSYGDATDLYVETLDPKDPDRYMEGAESLPFTKIQETLKIKDKKAPSGFREEKLGIKLTKRGPVVSDKLKGLKTGKVITLRWAPVQTMSPTIGFEGLLTARSIDDVQSALESMNMIMLNIVFADVEGNIGWRPTGKLPTRSSGGGPVPFVVKDGKDNWTGIIPFDKMPSIINPKRGWVGTCNHTTITRDYPYYYSSFLSPSYRYRRLMELLDTPGPKSVDDHWKFQRDNVNLMAKKIAPVMARALVAYKDTEQMGKILLKWDFRDDPDKAAPTIFQSVYLNFATLVFEDELGSHITTTMLKTWYFWQERLQKMVLSGSSPWFDNVSTKDTKETINDMFHQAALKAVEEMAPSLGKDPTKWLWGEAHQMEWVNPLRRKGAGKSLIGGGSHPMGGSGETLYRAIFDFDKRYNIVNTAALRMVADLADNDKVVAVMAGGVVGRTFNPHMKDQIEPFMRGDKLYWWFSDKAIKDHCKATLVLNPK